MVIIAMVLSTLARTGHMISTFVAVREPNNSIVYRTVSEWRREEDFSQDQRLINSPPRTLEQRARGTIICSREDLFALVD
jgi:hypothetical protein